MVTKRDGTQEEFKIEKIEKAMTNAFLSVKDSMGHNLYANNKHLRKRVHRLASIIDPNLATSVEDIQNGVENILMSHHYYDVAKSYILYREKHKQLRQFADKKIAFIENYIKSDNTANATIDDNSNVANHNIAVLNSEIHKEDNQAINLRILENKVKELYPNFDYKQMLRDFNTIAYLHDSSSQIGMPYCVAISLYPFLLNGLEDIGGLSAAPKNIDSFCGMFVNLVFAIASQFKGACLYKNQPLYVKNEQGSYRILAKDLINTYLVNPLKFSNYQGDWEYSYCNNLQILEDGKLVNITKVYRRKYSDKIYKITTKDGHTATVSKDHIFKQLFKGRLLDIKASQLQVNDTVVVNKDYSSIINYNSLDFKKGWIIGMLCGDGCLTKEASIGLSVNYEQEYLGDTFNEYLEEIYGFTLHKNKGHKCWNYAKRSQELLDRIHQDIISTTAYDKHINIYDKSIDYISGFLDGLFCADGSYSQSHGITISLTNLELANNIHEAITIFGLTSHICTVAPRENRRESYQQYISSKILKYLKHVHKKVLDRGCENTVKSSREIYYYGYNAFPGNNNSSKRMLWSNSKQDTVYNTDIIESIEVFDNDDEYVYEIETSSHWYNCGGFITHNCATPGMLLCMDYFLRKEWGDNYYLKENVIISNENCLRKQTIGKQIHQYFQQICYTLMQPSGSRGNQSVFWNLSIFDKPFFDTMYGDFKFPDGTPASWESLNWLQKNFLHWLNQERLKCILTFPVVSGCLIYQNGKFLDEELAEYFAQEYAQGNSFFTYISDSADSLSSCCRLSSKIEKPQFNFTNGQLSEMTGSKNVITLNFNRIIQDWALSTGVSSLNNPVDTGFWDEWKSNNSLKEYIINILNRIYKYQIAYNTCLQDLYNAGLLSVYSAGFISMKKQYLTIGINGLNQAAEFLGMECSNNEDYRKFCNFIFTTIKEQNTLHKTKDLMFNTEFTPCESAAIKLYNRDKNDGYWVPNDTNLYASYIYKPNDAKRSITEKIIMHGRDFCGDNLDGGSSAHLNLDAHLSVEQYRKLLKFAAEQGCKYFTFNVPNCQCEDCGFIAKQPFDKCPKCGSTNISLWDRVIGYLTKIKNWSAGRQIEQKTRVYSKEVK